MNNPNAAYKFQTFISSAKVRWESFEINKKSSEKSLIWKTEIQTKGSKPVEVIVDIQVKHTHFCKLADLN